MSTSCSAGNSLISLPETLPPFSRTDRMDAVDVAVGSFDDLFDALASLGAAAGLGFLAAYEGQFVTTLLPLFAAVAPVANAFGWLRHRQWRRSLLGIMGLAMVLAAMLLFFGRQWTARLLYAGLACTVGAASRRVWRISTPRPRLTIASPSPELAPGSMASMSLARQ